MQKWLPQHSVKFIKPYQQLLFLGHCVLKVLYGDAFLPVEQLQNSHLFVFPRRAKFRVTQWQQFNPLDNKREPAGGREEARNAEEEEA